MNPAQFEFGRPHWRMALIPFVTLAVLVFGTLPAVAQQASPKPAESGQPVDPATEPAPEPPPTPVVLYTTLEPAAVRPILEMFTERSGVPTRAVFEAELPNARPGALANQLKAERLAGKPRADVWWGADLIEVHHLAASGAFRRFDSDAAARHAGPGATQWPAELRASDGTWYGTARRLRVLAYNTDKVSGRDLPATLDQLTDARWTGRLAMSRPTAGSPALAHLAAIRAAKGESGFTEWLRALAAIKPLLLDSDAEVVRAVADGRAAIGLTTSNVAVAAAKFGQPVRMRLATDRDILPRGVIADGVMRFEPGLAQLPTGVAVVSGSENLDAAELLVDFILSNELSQVLERGPLQAIRLGDCAPEGLQRWCDGATGPGRLPRLVVGLAGFSVQTLAEQVAPAEKAWAATFPADTP